MRACSACNRASVSAGECALVSKRKYASSAAVTRTASASMRGRLEASGSGEIVANVVT